MTPKESAELAKNLRNLNVKINTLKNIYNELPLNPLHFPQPESYDIMKKSMAETIIEWDNQLTILQEKFLTL